MKIGELNLNFKAWHLIPQGGEEDISSFSAMKNMNQFLVNFQ